jgi:peptide/nickel transport system permease protein
MKELVSTENVWQKTNVSTKPSQTRKRRLAINHLFVGIAAFVMVFLIACTVCPQWIAPYSPTDMAKDSILKPPSLHHVFGTDYYGRDVFSVVVYGSRDSLFIGFASVVVGLLAGSTLGGFSGYVGGFVDRVLMLCIDILMTIPGILLALAIAASLGPSLFNIVLAVAIGAVPGYARVTRSQIMSVKQRPFVMASRSIGVSEFRVFWQHVLPNAWSPLLVMATIGLGSSILVGSGLSFLGLGVQKEIPDWGALLAQGRGYLTVGWWIATFPGLCITLFVLSVNVIGDTLRDYIDPKKHGR